MSTETSMQILVIILSTTLAIFLILSIVLVVKLLQITNVLKRTAEKAEGIVDNAEAVTEMFVSNTKHAVIGRFLANIADMVGRYGKDKQK